jgi:WD40 repeat protein
VTHGLGAVVLDARTREELTRIELPAVEKGGDPELVWDSTWTPDGSRLLLGAEGREDSTEDGGLVVVNPRGWQVERRVSPGRSPQQLEFSPNGAVLAVGAAIGGVVLPDEEVLVLDGTTYQVEHVLSLPDGAYPFDLSFSPDGRMLGVLGDNPLLTVFDTETWEPLHDPVRVHDGFGRQVEWLADGATVVTSASDGTVSLYDVTRDLVRVHGIPGSADGRSGNTAIFPPESQEIVAVTEDGPGRRYPMAVEKWVEYACLVAGRDLTEDEWARFVPTRGYERTCTDL